MQEFGGTLEPEAGELRALIDRARAGDADSFESLYQRYERSIFQLCFHLLGDRHAAEDATQQAFCGAWEQIGRLRHAAAFTAWLRSAALNACRHARRKGGRQQTFSETESDADELADPGAGPDASLAGDELTSAVRAALEQLSPDHREVVVLHHLQEVPLRDIAAALGVAEGTVKSRLGRARARLETLLAPYLEAET